MPSIPSDQELQSLIEGTLGKDEQARIEALVEKNPDCMRRLDEITGYTEFRKKYLKTSPPLTSLPSESLVDLIGKLKAGDFSRPTPEEEAFSILDVRPTGESPGQLGEFEVTEMIACGGMGLVFKARDPKLDREVAIKALPPRLAKDSEARIRFLKEARAVAALDHPNILPIYSVTDASQSPYFVMRLVNGPTLEELVSSEGALSESRMAHIGAQAARALEEAHRHDIIHRDVKPANLLLEGDRVWMADFGIAHQGEWQHEISGTPAFASPEQLEGELPTVQSDLYSLGATLRFASRSPRRRLGPVIRSLMQEDPVRRPSTALEVEQMLNRSIGIRWWRLSLLGLAVFLLLGFVFSNEINRTMGLRYVIEGNLIAHRSLRSAIEAAENGDTILVPGVDLIFIDQLQIPFGKELTLKAQDSESRPVLTTGASGTAGLISHSPLHLMGLDFRLNPQFNGDGILILHHSTTIEDCHFHSRYQRDRKRSNVRPRNIEQVGAGHLLIKNSTFDLQNSNAVTIRKTSAEDAGIDLTFEDCEIQSTYAVHLLSYQSPHEKIQISMCDSTFAGANFLQTIKGEYHSHIEVTATRSDIQTRDSLVWFRTDDTEGVLEHFRWVDSECSYSPRKDRVNVGEVNRLKDAFLLRRISAFGQAPPVRKKGHIRIVSTGKEFTDLAEAVVSAPAGSTLLLGGVFSSPVELLTPRGKELHFHAAPGESPLIETTHQSDHALFIRGVSTVQGITFRRYGGNETTRPILGFSSADSEVTDCRFEVLADVSAVTGGHGVGFSNVPHGIVRRCFFNMPASHAFFLAQSKPLGRSDRVTLEDCIFHTDTVLVNHRQEERCQTAISLKRCVVLGERLFSVSPRARFRSAEFHVYDCLFDLHEPFFVIPDLALAVFKKKFCWTGMKNHYSTAPWNHETVAPISEEHATIGPITSDMLKAALPVPVEEPILRSFLDHLKK